MKIINKLNKWANINTNLVTDLLRVMLGSLIFYKGLFFLEYTNYMVDILNPLARNLFSIFISNFVLLAHFAGGLLIVIGLLTRISVLAQIPILVGAIILNITFLPNFFELMQAIVLLITSIFFLFYGSGKHSVDYSLKLNI